MLITWISENSTLRVLVFLFLFLATGCNSDNEHIDNEDLKPILEMSCDKIISPWELKHYNDLYGESALTLDSLLKLPETANTVDQTRIGEIDVYLDFTGSMLGFYDGGQRPMRILQTLLSSDHIWHTYGFRSEISWLEASPILSCIDGPGANWKILSSRVKESRKKISASQTTPLENILLSVADSCIAKNTMAIIVTDGLNSEELGMSTGDLITFQHHQTLAIQVNSVPARFKGKWYGDEEQKFIDDEKQLYLITVGSTGQLYHYNDSMLSVPALEAIIDPYEVVFFPVSSVEPCFSIRSRSGNTKGMTVGNKEDNKCYQSYVECFEVEGGAEILLDVSLKGKFWNEEHIDFGNIDFWSCSGEDGFEVIAVEELPSDDDTHRRDCSLASHTIRLRCPVNFGQENLELSFSVPSSMNMNFPQELGDWMTPLNKLYHSSNQTELISMDVYISSLKD